MKACLLFIFLIFSPRVLGFSPFAEASLGLNTLTDITEGSLSESGLGTNLNAKGGLFLGPFFGGADLNFSVISTDDVFFNKIEENSYGLVGGMKLANISRVWLTLYPFAEAEHDNGQYKGFGYKLGLAVFLPFLPFVNLMMEYRDISYDKKRIGGSYQGTPELNSTSLIFSLGVFFD